MTSPAFVLFFALLCLSPFVLADCPNDCYANWDQGTCNTTTNECQCNPLYTGDDCSINYDPKYDWDRVDCHGGRFFPPTFTPGVDRYCICPEGFQGPDCTVCNYNNSCNCSNDFSLDSYDEKFFNCSSTDPEINGLLGGTVGYTFACIANQTCEMAVYERDDSVPLLANCTFSDCVYTSDESQRGFVIACQQSACTGTSFNTLLQQVFDTAKTTMEFVCGWNGTCMFTQKEISAEIPSFHMQCDAGMCLN